MPTHHAERILGVKGLQEWKAGRARWQDLLQGDLTRTMSGQPGLMALLAGGIVIENITPKHRNIKTPFVGKLVYDKG